MRKQLLKYVLVLGVILVSAPGLFFMPTPAHATGTTFNVDDTADRDDGVCNPGLCTIRDAFAIAGNGDTISIPAGTYNSSVDLSFGTNKSLTITGAGSSLTTIALSGTSEMNILGGADHSALTISGVKITAEGNYAIGYKGLLNGGNIDINNVIITGAAKGIWIGATETNGATYTGNISVTNSTITASEAGVVVGYTPGAATSSGTITGSLAINNNNITVNNSSGSLAGILLYGTSVTGTTDMTNNTITITKGGASGSQVTGIKVSDNDTGTSTFGGAVNMNSNTISATPDFASALYVGFPTSSSITLNDNTVTGNVILDSQASPSYNSPILVADAQCLGGPGVCSGITTANITNNTINTTGGDSTVQAIMSLANTNNISGNDITQASGNGSLPNGILCAGVSTTTACTATSNLITGFGSIGIASAVIFDNTTSTTKVSNNVIRNGNAAGTTDPNNSSGVYIGEMQLGPSAPINVNAKGYVFNNTIYNIANTSGTQTGGAIETKSDDSAGSSTSHVTVYASNNIIQNNANGFSIQKGGVSEDNTITSDYNIVYANTLNSGSNYNGVTPGGQDKVSDALFVNAAGGDFQLQSTSPAVDAAVASFGSPSQAAPTTDFLGIARPQRAAIDMGAYEHINQGPSANAGVDQSVVVGDLVTLHCASTDPESDTISYTWSRTSGPSSVTFTGGGTADASFTPAAVGTYVVQCTTNDAYDPGSNDSLNIVVAAANVAPTANAGPDQNNITVGSVVTLNCAGSSDPENDTLTYGWTQTDGTSVTLSSSSVATPTFTPANVGVFTFQCGVNDGHHSTVSDSVTIHVNAHRLSGADRYATPVAISQQQFANHSTTSLVIATGTNFPDSLAAGPLASLIGGPILLVQPTALPSGVATEILRVLNTTGATNVYIAGGTSAVSSGVANAIASLDEGINIIRLSGSDRYATALLIAQRMDTIRGSGPTKIAIATGAGFADAAAISSPASNATIAAGRIPILLTSSSALPSAVASYISSNSGTITKAYIPGGTAVVSDVVKTAIENVIGVGNVTRLSGSDRYATAAAIATEFYGDSNAPTKVAVGTGRNFPDLLAGGPNAGAANMPILYNNAATVPTATSNYVTAHSATLNYLFLYGGTAVVPDSVKTTLQSEL